MFEAVKTTFLFDVALRGDTCDKILRALPRGANRTSLVENGIFHLLQRGCQQQARTQIQHRNINSITSRSKNHSLLAWLSYNFSEYRHACLLNTFSPPPPPDGRQTSRESNHSLLAALSTNKFEIFDVKSLFKSNMEKLACREHD